MSNKWATLAHKLIFNAYSFTTKMYVLKMAQTRCFEVSESNIKLVV